MNNDTTGTFGLGKLFNVLKFDRKKEEPVLLNKSEAAHKLHEMYEKIITKYKLEDLHPDFYSLLTENARNPMPASSFEGSSIKRLVRGNRSRYGMIKIERIKGRPMYKLETLTEWFNDYYVASILKKAA